MLLLISDRGSLRTALARALTERGLFVLECTAESAVYVTRKKDVGGVLLDAVPDPAGAARLFRALRAEERELPIAYLAPCARTVDVEADAILRETDGPLVDAVEDFYVHACGWRAPVLSSHALYVDATPEGTRYMGYAFPLSPLEHRILRCLFYRYPRLTSAEDLLELCCAGGTRSIRNVAVHIGRINRAAARIDARPLIVNTYRVGYRLRDGIADGDAPTSLEKTEYRA